MKKGVSSENLFAFLWHYFLIFLIWPSILVLRFTHVKKIPCMSDKVTDISRFSKNENV